MCTSTWKHSHAFALRARSLVTPTHSPGLHIHTSTPTHLDAPTHSLALTHQPQTHTHTHTHTHTRSHYRSVGGKNMSCGLNVHRFANRIPLIFEQSSDLVTVAAQDLNWGLYKINIKEDKVRPSCCSSNETCDTNRVRRVRFVPYKALFFFILS
jgi:hypothetical protein